MSLSVVHEGLALLAQSSPTSPTVPVGPEYGKASPIGLAVILLLLVGTVLLVRSMNTHLRKLPESFEPASPEPDQLADEGTDRGGVAEASGEHRPDRSQPASPGSPGQHS